ncbi:MULTISPECIES: glycine zipper 2TM domain-containing protein [Acidovorax]|uniref:glycine zipper 2TM domain-containing protein n=1 Tax=Acidovorax TaxID=12916 RepID=UPI002584F9D6|nr:glycine zipper 2TM domain-containing protein [Acidovorax sp.]
MRKITRFATLAGSALLLGALAACAPQQPYPSQYPTQYPSGGYSSGGYQSNAPVYSNQPMGTEYGRVANIEVLQARSQGQTTGVGAVLGAVVGGVLGNQVGGGSGRTAATAVGAVGGALAGNAIEGRNRDAGGAEVQGYRISIQLDQGGYRSYDVSHPGDLRPGDRVRLYNGQISRL